MSIKKPLIVNFLAGPGALKCFREGTTVIAYNGKLVKVEDIKIGDKLLGPDSKKRTVQNLSSGITNIYKVIPTKGASFYVNSNHILPLKLHHHGVEKEVNYTVEAFNKLSDWQKTRLKLYRSECIEFKPKKVPIDPYFIGLWLGDGNNRDQGITTEDSPIIKYLTNIAITNEMKLTKVGRKGEAAATYTMSNGAGGGKPNKILNILRDLDLIYNKHIPNVYKINSLDVRKRLLAGLIDSDGTNNSNCYSITTKYKILAEEIMFLCRSIGLAAYIGEAVVNNKIYYYVSISGELSDIPVLLERKRCKTRKQIKNVLRTGLKIIYEGKGMVYGFEVDKDHLFLLNDFTVTHNSGIASGVFSLLKLHYVDCELVTEYPKDLAWEENWKALSMQGSVFGEQNRRLARIENKVDVIVTDTSLLFSLIYRREALTDAFERYVLDVYNTYNNLNIFLTRNDSAKYEDFGREQSKSEAIDVDNIVKVILEQHNIKHVTLEPGVNSINKVTSMVLKTLNKDLTFEIK